MVGLFLLAALGAEAKEENGKLTGYIFRDMNHNGVMDQGETGIPGILVSNQEDMIRTDASGKFEINIKGKKTVYVVKPSDYNVPAYYVNVSQLKGSRYDFAMIPKAVKKDFKTLMVGDPQMRTDKTLHCFQEDIVTEMFNHDVDFAVIMGDIADNDLSIYPKEKAIVSKLPYPVYRVFGNHDADYPAASVNEQADVFIEHYGPDYYSFNEGDVHFIVLDNVYYQGWNKEKNKQGDYFGALSEIQYKWLEADLSHVGQDKLIVLCMHIPLLEQYSYQKDIRRIFSLLEGRTNLLALSGHLHTVENYFFKPETNWNSEVKFQSVTVGAACGSWWCGPIDERGLPVSTCMDGSPNGYFEFIFSGNKYAYRFIAADHREDFQMRLTVNGDKLYANIFAATKGAAVTAVIDGGEPVSMQNVREKDPFISTTYAQRKNFDDWQPGLMETEHLWSMPLPALSAGVHYIKVTGVDVNGKTFIAHKLLKVE